MEMSFCHLGFARPVVLLPKAQMLVTTVFPELAREGKEGLEGGRERQTDGPRRSGREMRGKIPLRGNLSLGIVLFEVLKKRHWVRKKRL